MHQMRRENIDKSERCRPIGSQTNRITKRFVRLTRTREFIKPRPTKKKHKQCLSRCVKDRDREEKRESEKLHAL